MCFKMTGNSSDDNESDSDNSFGSTKIKPEWMELQNNQQFYIDEWPNRLPSEKQPEPNIENIVQLLRKQSRARSSVQNGCNEKENAQGSAPNISQQEFDRISSTVNTDDLMEIIGCVNGPSQPALNPNQQPPPPPLPPPTMPAQLHPRPPPPTMPTQLLPRPPPHPHTQSSNMTNVVPQHFNTSQPPLPLQPQSYYPMNGAPINVAAVNGVPMNGVPMNGIPMDTTHYAHPNIAPYINSGMSNIPAQFIPNGNPVSNPFDFDWRTRNNQNGAAPRPFNVNSMPTPQLNPIRHPNMHDPRLQARPPFHQRQQQQHQPSPYSTPNQNRLIAHRPNESPAVKQRPPPPAQSTPIQSMHRPNERPSRWAPMNRNDESSSAFKRRISIDAYKRKGQTHQSEVISVEGTPPITSNACKNNTNKESEVVPAMDPIPSQNNLDDDDNDSNEPTFSPAASISNPSSPASATPTPPPPTTTLNENENESEPDEELHASEKDTTQNQNPERTVTQNGRPIKEESQQYESDGQTDASDDSVATVEFNLENLRAHFDLNEQHVDSEPISNEMPNVPSMQQMNDDTDEYEAEDEEIAEEVPIKQKKHKKQKKEKKKQKDPAKNFDEIEDELKNMEGDGEIVAHEATVQIESTDTMDVEQNANKEGDVQAPELECKKPVQNNQPIVAACQRCFIYLEDIGDSALFDKYIKKNEQPTKSTDEPEKTTEKPKKPIDEPKNKVNKPKKSGEESKKPVDVAKKVVVEPKKSSDESNKSADESKKPVVEPNRPVDEPMGAADASLKEDLSPIEVPDSDDDTNGNNNDESSGSESKVFVISSDSE